MVIVAGWCWSTETVGSKVECLEYRKATIVTVKKRYMWRNVYHCQKWTW